jgi:lipopolysaccharide transport system permease protein
MRKEIEIIANSGFHLRSKFNELIEYRSLLFELSKRDLKSRYAQTIFGLAWTLINPLISVLLLYFVFGVVVKANTEGIPPILFVMSGLCIWNFFARVVGDSGQSLLGAQAIIKKIYFPRLIIPFSKVLVSLVDLLVVILLLAILLLFYQYPMSWRMLGLIPLLVLAVLTSLAFGIWSSALTIRFRDFSQVIPIALRIGMFISPIGYSISAVPAKYYWWYKLNPLTGLIDGFRSLALGLPFEMGNLWYTLVVSLIVMISGIGYFIRIEKYIGDIV